MGKEAIFRPVAQLDPGKITPSDHPKTPPYSYINALWNPHAWTKPEELKGSVSVTVQSRDKEIRTNLAGFGIRHNESKELIKQLLVNGVIGIETKLIKVLKLEEDLWRRVPVPAFTFNSGDVLLLIVEESQNEKRKENIESKRKSIRKVDKKVKVFIK
eukprot:TRINITY_DN8180_c0_g1_i5.p1 TRINITY_DN8180_c0_g1~~TRINITY_DN8180_c0_g1_i5.p1  ORF type:complete len:158 (-),score=58.71 TRINITY_DN8180_c0_g1_i5:114-587(-)